ncbi:MAG: Omp28-related outer membrane protein [Flavobacterium sp.]|nr:Omp28-related outer membrane protein [Flavobacterium sp.]
MKLPKLPKLPKLSILFILVAFLGCTPSSDNEDTPLPPTNNGPEFLILTSDKLMFEVGETATFSVVDDEDDNITSQSTISVDGVAISGSTFTPADAGNFEIKATYLSVNSNVIDITVNAPVTLSSVDVTLSSTAIFIGDILTLTATAVYTDDSTVDITSETEFYVDDVLISGNEYIGVQLGTIEVKAVFESTTSSVFQVEVVDPSNLPASFSKKAVVEDFTGTWCGYCPRVSYAASLVEAQTDKVFVVGVHNGDQMANGFGNALENMYNITGFPTAYIDRANTWTYPEPNNVSQALNAAQGTVDVGLAIETSLTGSNLDITISQGFLQNMTNVKLLVFVLEDGIIADQSNYTSYYGGASTILNFEHNGVLRYVATDIMGDTTTSTIGIHEQSFSVNLSSQGVQDPTKTGVLAMLVDDLARVLYNAQYVISGQTQDFD